MYTTRVSKYQTHIPKRAPWRTTLIAFLALFLAACGGGGGSVHSVPGAAIPMPDGKTPRTAGGSTVQLTSEPTSGGDTPSARDSTPDAITRTDPDVITPTERLDFKSIGDWLNSHVSLPANYAYQFRNKIHEGRVTFQTLLGALPAYPDGVNVYTGEDRFFKGATYTGVVAGLEVDRNSVVTRHSGTMSLEISDNANATGTTTFNATFSDNLPLDPMIGGTVLRTVTGVSGHVESPEPHYITITYLGEDFVVGPLKPTWFLKFNDEIKTNENDNTKYIQFMSGRFYKEGELAAGRIDRLVIASENKEDINNVGFSGIFETNKQE